MKKFEYLDEVATADIAFRARGATLAEMFENAAMATSEAMIDTTKVKQTIIKEIIFENEDVEQLLYDFLSEIIYYKDAENLMFSKYEATMNGRELKVKMSGEEFHKEMGFKIDVKAITMHLLKIEKKHNNFECTIVLDI